MSVSRLTESWPELPSPRSDQNKEMSNFALHKKTIRIPKVALVLKGARIPKVTIPDISLQCIKCTSNALHIRGVARQGPEATE